MKPNTKEMVNNLWKIQNLIRDLHIYCLDEDKVLSDIASKLYELKEIDNGLFDATELLDKDKEYTYYINKEELKDKINNILNARYKPWFEKVNGLKEEILEMLK